MCCCDCCDCCKCCKPCENRVPCGSRIELVSGPLKGQRGIIEEFRHNYKVGNYFIKLDSKKCDVPYKNWFHRNEFTIIPICEPPKPKPEKPKPYIFCPSCGKKIIREHNFCFDCGTKLVK